MSPTDYRDIFFTNVLKILNERDITNDELSRKSQISGSYISKLSRGQANPSLKTMCLIADALDVPLPTLLESTDLNRKALAKLSGGKVRSSLPKGFERVSAILTSFEAYVVKGQDEANREKLLEMSSAPKNS